MIGILPNYLEVDGVEYEIDSDFRTALLIMDMYNDKDLSPMGKHLTMLEILYTPVPNKGEDLVTNIPPNLEEAVNQAMWFLDIGQERKSKKKVKVDIDGKAIRDEDGNVIMEEDSTPEPELLNYKQDEQLLFSAVNAAFSRDVRAESHLHWWTFYGLCQSISNDSLISTIMGIRSKLANGEKLEPGERKYLRDNEHIVLIKKDVDEDKYNNMTEDLRQIKNK